MAAPTITGFTPDGGPTGTTVIIQGTHFTGVTDVSFGLTPAAHYTIDNDLQITAVVAAGTSTGAVKVTNPSGLATGSNFTIVTGVQVPDKGNGGVCVSVAFANNALDASPTWTDITAHANLVTSYDFDRGRQFELDYTDTGTYEIKIQDVHGLLDPTNPSSLTYGGLDTDIQIRVELWNPRAGYWSTRFRGWIEDYDFDMDPSQGVQTLTITCYDIIGLLSLIEMQPTSASFVTFGETPPSGSEGNVFFGDEVFQDRIEGVLGDAGIPGAFYEVFSGNVRMTDGVYSPGDTPMNVIQDALDAEFPGVSNGYPDRKGRLAVHGRLAKFTPGTIAAGAGDAAWDYRVWYLGDGAAIAADTYPKTIQIRPPYSWNHGKGHIINSAMCYPATMGQSNSPAQQALIAGQLFQDATSLGEHGYGSWSRENVNIDVGILTGNTGAAECLAFAKFFVANYANPRPRPTALTVMSLYPTDVRGGRVWDFLCNVDIADLIHLTIAHPGGGGFTDEQFFVEGVRETCEPLDKNFSMVTVSLDVSPKAYFDDPAGLDGA